MSKQLPATEVGLIGRPEKLFQLRPPAAGMRGAICTCIGPGGLKIHTVLILEASFTQLHGIAEHWILQTRD